MNINALRTAEKYTWKIRVNKFLKFLNENNMIKKFVRKVYDLIAKIYIFVFGRKVMQKINSAIFY